MNKRISILITIIVLACAESWACRYSVRDTGFVDIGDEHYRLVLAGKNPDERIELYRGICAASLLNANITFEVSNEINVDEPSLILMDSMGRKLVLAQGSELPTKVTAAANLIESVSMSPLRAKIHELSLESFAVVLLVEGGPAAEINRVRHSIEVAIDNIALLMPSMPKPVDTPPALISITPGQFAEERVAIWGLGLDPVAVAEPRVSIVYGRGRRVGDFMEGPLVTQTVLQERLSIIGQDCECELDRKWMKGPMFPARWDAGRQRQAVQLLGFDPENPMVRAEVSRIVLRGPGTGQVRKLSGGSSAFGYTEVSLNDIRSSEPQTLEEAPDVSQPDQPATSTIATATPLEQTGQITWFVVLATALVALVLAILLWRKMKREQG